MTNLQDKLNDPNITQKEKKKLLSRMKYVSGIPRKLPKGRVLVHNHVVPQAILGANGFRAWTEPLADHLVLCDCDWAGRDLHGLRHYRVKSR